jgi:hypothetical protein
MLITVPLAGGGGCGGGGGLTGGFTFFGMDVPLAQGVLIANESQLLGRVTFVD